MKIVCIFEGRLYSLHYKDEEANEVDRLFELWTDPGLLHAYATDNLVGDVYAFIANVLRNAEDLENLLEKIEKEEQRFGVYFQVLQESEYGKVLSFQKGKIKRNYLRLYALQVDRDCYLITGGAIKMCQKMKDHPDTAHELLKLKQARDYLRQNGVFDLDSFFELITI